MWASRARKKTYTCSVPESMGARSEPYPAMSKHCRRRREASKREVEDHERRHDASRRHAVWDGATGFV
ncbi:hypothetical protein [Alicyclobacillus sp. SP_1]|uniref:hypothetical protein n=1 Tax=Alicyclobacillus sp. SP_1 TaxID=2942475 RepID=UPI0035BE316D